MPLQSGEIWLCIHTLKAGNSSGQRHLSNEVTEIHLPSLKIDRVSFLSMTSNPHAIFFLAWSSLSYCMTPAVKALCIVGPFSLDSPHIYWRGHMYHLHEHLRVQGKILAAEKNRHGVHFCVSSLHYFIYLGGISLRNLSGSSQAYSWCLGGDSVHVQANLRCVFSELSWDSVLKSLAIMKFITSYAVCMCVCVVYALKFLTTKWTVKS